MAEQVNVPVPEEMEQIVDMPVLSNGRWLTGTGGDVEYVKTLTSSVALLKRKVDLAVVTDSQDTTSERDGRTRDVAEMRGAVELMQDWVTEAESVATQLFEIVEVIRLVAQKRIHERTVEETVGVPVPHVMEEIVGVVRQEISVWTDHRGAGSQADWWLRRPCARLERAHEDSEPKDWWPFATSTSCWTTVMSSFQSG